MLSKNITVNATTGLHARPAAELVSFVKKYKCTVNIKSGTKVGNCSSIISVLALGIKCGTEVELVVEGENEEVALAEISEFIEKLKD